MNCKHVDCCGFFNKFQSKKSLLWKAMVKQHCEDGGVCVRREMFDDGQTPSSDDLMPAGVNASKAFLSLL
jgi:hypothetical protein